MATTFSVIGIMLLVLGAYVILPLNDALNEVFLSKKIKIKIFSSDFELLSEIGSFYLIRF